MKYNSQLTTKKTQLCLLILMTLSVCNVQAGIVKAGIDKAEQDQTKDYPEIPSILDIYNMALEYDTTVSATKYRTNAEKEARAQAWASLLPKANVNVFTRINDNTTETESGFFADESRYNESGYSIALSQPIFNIPAYIGLSEAKLKIKKAELTYLGQEQALIGRVAQAYLNLIIAQSNLTVAETQQRSIEELLQRAKLNFELGTATISDTREAQAARDTVHARTMSRINELKIAKHKLFTLTGKHIDDVEKLAVDLPLDIETLQLPPLEGLTDLAVKTNLRLNISRIDHALAKSSLYKIQSSRLPTVDLIATSGENNTNGSSFAGSGKIDTDFYVVGAELNMPLFAGGGINSNARSAKNMVYSSDEQIKTVEKTIILELTEAYLNVELAQSSVKAFREAVSSARLSLDSTRLGFELGERTSLDVLAAQQTFYAAIRDHTESQYNYLIASLGVNLSLGLISVKDIIAIAELIDDLNDTNTTNN